MQPPVFFSLWPVNLAESVRKVIFLLAKIVCVKVSTIQAVCTGLSLVSQLEATFLRI